MTYQGYSSLLKAPPPRTATLCSTTITVLHLTHYLYPSLPSPTLPLCPSPPPRLATALCAQHLIKVMLNKTVSPACSLARRCCRACVHSVGGSQCWLCARSNCQTKSKSLEAQCICQSAQIREWMRLPEQRTPILDFSRWESAGVGGELEHVLFSQARLWCC